MLPKGLLKEYSQILSLIMRGLDMAAVMTAGLMAYFYKFGHFHLSQSYQSALVIAGILTLIVFPFFQLYESVRVKSFWQYIRYLMHAMGMVLILLAGLSFFTKSGADFSRIWFMAWGGISISLLITFRCGLLLLLRLMRTRGWNERRVIIIGAGELGVKLVDTIQQALWTGFHIVAIFDDEVPPQGMTINGIPVKQTPPAIDQYIDLNKEYIDEIWLALPLSAEERVKRIMHELRHQTITTRFVLDMFGMDLLNHSITNLAGFPAINLNATPMVGMNRLIKAIEDRVLAFLILIIISPLFFLIAVGVKWSSPGPVFFKQRRHGWDGHIIQVYKFRTMVEHKEEEDKVTQATQNDQRVTSFGRFLRKTSLDELPQFLNVLRGEMSIVGPRPHAVSHNEFYKDSIKAYMQRHKVKPGITGWAQINGWRGETKTLDKMQKRVEYDLYYIENWSLLFDLKIIFLTVTQGIFHDNAY